MKNIFLNIMKMKYGLATLLILLLSVSSCDKGFVEMNVNPISPATMDPVYMLVDAQRLGTDTWHYEAEICQQMQLLIGGQEEGGNRNTVNFGNMEGRFNAIYGNQIKNTVNIINLTKDNPAKSNLYNMARIMKAFSFQWLVDTYGDLPYFEAGKAYISGINLPKYDAASAIYDDIVKELTEAVDALDASKDRVPGEMYFAGDIAKWKKFGNSALLRVGMRYAKSNALRARAKEIVVIATDPARGGVMSANSENIVVKYNSVQTNPGNGFASNSTKYNWHVGLPFMNLLKNNADPRLQYISVKYADPSGVDHGAADTVMANQIGCPFGYTDVTITSAPNYPGKIGTSFKYSQFSRETFGRVDAWQYFLTASQTQLLMAEARERGFITTSTVQAYYEAGIRLNMTQEDIYSATRGAASPISTSKINRYIARPGIAFDAANALKQINEQYYISSLANWPEAWANVRRSGFPVLTRINFPGEDPSVTAGDGFIHRLMYPVREKNANTLNANEAIERMGGDNLGIRLFWDTL